MINPAGSPSLAIPVSFSGGPDYERDHIFELFEKYAASYLMEIYGRHFWSTGKFNLSPSAYLVRNAKNKRRAVEGKPPKMTIKHFVDSVTPTVCQITEEGLMTALFGPQWDGPSAKHVLALDKEAGQAIASLKNILRAHEPGSLHQRFKSVQTVVWTPYPTLDQNNWNAFRIGIGGGIGHALVLIQAYENNQVVYKLYQSFVQKYTLQEYLKQKTNTLTFSEVNLMLDEILDYVVSKTWSAGADHLYSRFFNVKMDYKIGEEISFNRYLRIKWGHVTREAMKQYAQEYQKAFPADLKFK